jgi:predicted dehydrogenase
MNRRSFLTSLAGAGVASAFPAIIPASALGANGTTAPSNRIVMGAIGVGGMGTGDMRMFLAKSDVRMAAVCDVRESNRERAKGLVNARYGDSACATYNDFRELLERKDIDAVVIATGERWHPLIGIEAARQGKHMYCEKPMGVSVEQSKALREAVNRYGVVFQFGTQQRSSQYYRSTCELVRNGRIGRLHTIMIASNGGNRSGFSWPDGRIPDQMPEAPPAGLDYEMWLGPAPWAPYTPVRVSQIWMMIRDYGLGHMGGVWGVHDVDFAQWANGTDDTTPTEIEGAALFHDDIRDTEYIYDVELKYANGVRMLYMDLATARKRAGQFRFGGMSSLFIGTEGWIWVSREGMRTHPESLMHAIIGPNEIRVIKSNDHRQNLLDAIRTGQPTISPIHAATNADIICHQADIACRLKRKLRWDPVKEEFIGDPQANTMMSRALRGPWQLQTPERSI